MTQVGEPDHVAAGDEYEDAEVPESATIADLTEQVGRATAALVRRELEVIAARHAPALRTAGRDVVLAAIASVAFVTAFALANWAAVAALSNAVPDWLAPLVVSAAWAVVGVVIVVSLRNRYRPAQAWTRDPAALVKDREQARDDAGTDLRASLDDLANAVADEALARIHEALVPAADDVVELGEDVLEVAEEFSESLEGVVPGGGVVSGAIDLALLPGRLSIRVVRVVLGANGRNGEATPADVLSCRGSWKAALCNSSRLPPA